VANARLSAVVLNLVCSDERLLTGDDLDVVKTFPKAISSIFAA